MSTTHRFSSLLWLVLAIPAVGYAHTDAETGQDYSGFDRNDGRGSCCNWLDCRPASEPFMEQDGEKITDRAGNKFSFDPSKVVKRPSDDGNWHVCGNGTTLKCIIAPTETRRESIPLDRLFGWVAPENPAGQSLLPGAKEIELELAKAPICK
jgi:hypothetical protein